MPTPPLSVPTTSDPSIPEPYRLAAPVEQRAYLCGGDLREWNGPFQEVFSPVGTLVEGTHRPLRLGSYPLLTEKEALQALDAACAAYDNGRGEWPTMTVEQRIRCIEEFGYRMEEQREAVVKLLMWEIGKPAAEAEIEFDRTIDYISDTIAALKDLDHDASRFVIEQGVIAQIRRAPLGVVLCMGPFNYPLNETFATLIPALIMGNTAIFKAPKLGVLLHEPLLEAFRDCFPKGVVNTVYGDGQQVISPLLKSGKLNVLAFIGSSRVADGLRRQHPKSHRLRCVLGLEAKNAAVVLPDADLELAIKECVNGALAFNGQRCTALKILFVHESLVEHFTQKFCAAVAKLKLGLPWEAGVQITPLPEPGKTAYLTGLIEDAKAKGARLLNDNGGTVSHTFMTPAVMYPVGPGMRLYVEEQFGPVVPIVPFADIEEPMQYVIESDYGQQISLFGSDPEQLADLIDPLVNQVCRVNINSKCQRGPDAFPFTGRKDSAEGTLSVSDALLAFTIRAVVAAKENDSNRKIIKAIVRNRESRFLSTDFIL